MGGPERIFNLLLSLSVWSWAILGLTATADSERASAVRFCIAGLHGLVGLLFLVRVRVRNHGSIADICTSLPAIAVGGWALAVAPPLDQWPALAIGIFVTGATWTVIALASLGRSFAVLPAARPIVTHGPYGIVRHPAYIGEFLLIGACFAARPHWQTALPAALALPWIALRIRAEERLLATLSEYRDYRRKVRWRFFPGVW